MSAYQHTTDEDEDPETDDSTGGIVDRQLVGGVQRGQGTLLFWETLSALECLDIPPFPTQSVYCDINAAKVHEVGHLFGAEHGDGGVLDSLDIQYSAASIAVIRGRDYP